MKSGGVTEMTNGQYFTKKINTSVKRNKSTPGYQCVDLAKDYLICVKDIYKKLPGLSNWWAWGNAITWATPNNESKKVFDFLPPDTALKTGDLIVMKSTDPNGHICIYAGFSDDKSFISLDQNMGGIQKCLFYKHPRASIVKILRWKV